MIGITKEDLEKSQAEYDLWRWTLKVRHELRNKKRFTVSTNLRGKEE